MKIALYIEDGLEQVVLTPESETEQSILSKIHDGSRTLALKRGGFYACHGGWTRWKKTYPSLYGTMESEREDESTIIVLRPAPLSSEQREVK